MYGLLAFFLLFFLYPAFPLLSALPSIPVKSSKHTSAASSSLLPCSSDYILNKRISLAFTPPLDRELACGKKSEKKILLLLFIC